MEPDFSYPYLVTVNSVIPAIIAGNAVVLKPSPQTPLTAERFARAFIAAGVPKDVIQVLHLSPELTLHAVQHELVNFISFTGSVVGGRTVQEDAVHAKGFKGTSLEVRPALSEVVNSNINTDLSLVEKTPHMSEQTLIWITQSLKLLTVS